MIKGPLIVISTYYVVCRTIRDGTSAANLGAVFVIDNSSNRLGRLLLTPT